MNYNHRQLDKSLSLSGANENERCNYYFYLRD